MLGQLVNHAIRTRAAGRLPEALLDKKNPQYQAAVEAIQNQIVLDLPDGGNYVQYEDLTPEKQEERTKFMADVAQTLDRQVEALCLSLDGSGLEFSDFPMEYDPLSVGAAAPGDFVMQFPNANYYAPQTYPLVPEQQLLPNPLFIPAGASDLALTEIVRCQM